MLRIDGSELSFYYKSFFSIWQEQSKKQDITCYTEYW